MLYCPKCGAENPDDALACAKCNFSLSLVGRYVASPESIDSSTITFSKGYSIGKRYQIVDEIGRGGMGIVYKAKDMMLNDYVALKLLLPQLTTDSEIMDRFKREVLAARKIAHPNVIKVYDIGEKNNITFISMEYLTGTDLKRKIKVKGALSIEEAINVVTQICAGLEAAHEMGVVHRDIKPQNIFITKKNQVKLMDFGIARAGDLTGLTTAGTLVGTPEYMSPEQADPKKTVDSRTDIYSLGIVMYEIFCGRVPFRADTPIETVIKHLMEEPEPLRFANPKISPAIDFIVMKTLQKDPNKRYQRAKDVAADFEKFVLKETETIDLREMELTPTIKTEEKPPKPKKIPIKEAPPGEAVSAKKGMMKLLIPLAAVVVIAIISFLLYSYFKERKQRIANLTERAQAVFQQEQYITPPDENALKFANDILAIDKNNKFALDMKDSIAEIYRKQADENFAAEKWEEARTNYDILLRVKPEDNEALNRIAEIREKIEGVQPVTATGEEDQEQLIASLNERAQAAFRQERYISPARDNALKFANDILTIDRNNKFALDMKASIADIYRKRANDSFSARKWEEALTNYNVLLRVVPNDREALNRIAKLNNRMRRSTTTSIAVDKEADDYTAAGRADTIAAWQRFLNTYPNSQYTQQARRRIQQLQNTPGYIVISAFPLAEAYLDGNKVGNTPPKLRVEAQPGKHEVVLEIKDYESYTQEVTVNPRRETTVHHAFKPFGSLVVNCTPWANISIDGKDYGTTPLTIRKLSEGEHTVVLTREGFKTLERSVTIKAQDTARLVLNLERE